MGRRDRSADSESDGPLSNIKPLVTCLALAGVLLGFWMLIEARPREPREVPPVLPAKEITSNGGQVRTRLRVQEHDEPSSPRPQEPSLAPVRPEPTDAAQGNATIGYDTGFQAVPGSSRWGTRPGQLMLCGLPAKSDYTYFLIDPRDPHALRKGNGFSGPYGTDFLLLGKLSSCELLVRAADRVCHFRNVATQEGAIVTTMQVVLEPGVVLSLHNRSSTDVGVVLKRNEMNVGWEIIPARGSLDVVFPRWSLDVWVHDRILVGTIALQDGVNDFYVR